MTTTNTDNVINMHQLPTSLNGTMNQEDLDSVFARLSPPKIDELSEAYQGRLYAVEGVRRLPRLLRGPLHAIVNSPVSPWKGKFINGRQGGNMLLNRHGKRQLGFYRVTRGKAYDDGRPVIELDYDVPENPPSLWPIRGELRALGEQYYLARMLYRTRTGYFTVLYFSLEK
ncbi:hypothetical protein F1529_04670 [Alcanivorax sp. VBW004]|uniref:hypothetical protein n=1 Tax=Alcanivorax sp. VBW004 TaxID=1287708 RepID=UPI0012BB8558|nr:hypothetical protein [Alcanivorax sp. VBW004]MTT51776.1 hypothetical protein [Alcanivorax sp. VBW004]